MLADLVADAAGTVFGLDAHGRVWAMDLAGELRWSATVELAANRGNSLGLAPNGRLLAWGPQDHAGWVLGAETGELLGNFGGVEPAGASVHHLDLLGIKSLTPAPDGTLLAIFQERLLRFGRDGVGVDTWPGVRSGPAPLYRACPTRPATDSHLWDVALRRRAVGAAEALGYDWREFDVTEVPSRPLAFAWSAEPSLHACPDGSLLVRTAGRSGRNGLCRLDPSGARVFAMHLPFDDLGDPRRACCDDAGNAYVQGEHRNPRGDPYAVVLRVSPDGRVVDEPVRDARLDGSIELTDPEQFAVTAGHVVLAANHGRMQVLPIG
jgi:hypothetical protein